MKTQRPWIVKAILTGKNKAEAIILPDFKIYYKAIVIKTVYIGIKTDMWTNGTEFKHRNTYRYGQLIFDEVAKNTQWGTDILFNKWYWMDLGNEFMVPGGK